MDSKNKSYKHDSVFPQSKKWVLWVDVLSSKLRVTMKIKLEKHKGNSVYSIYTEKYGQKHHLDFVNAKEIDELLPKNLQEKYDNIKPPCPAQEMLASAIKSMIDLDIKRGVKPNLD